MSQEIETVRHTSRTSSAMQRVLRKMEEEIAMELAMEESQDANVLVFASNIAAGAYSLDEAAEQARQLLEQLEGE